MGNWVENGEWTVYVHIVPRKISGYSHDKYYVGITKRVPKKRWGHNGCGYKNIHFYNAINKYGWDNIEHHIIANNLTHDEANTFEKLLIQKLQSNDREYGYNISDGGDGGNKKELKPVKQFDLDGNFIKEYSSAAMAASELGFDRTHITRVCKHGGETHGYLFCYSEEHSVKPFRKRKTKNVIQTDLDGNFISKYNSLKEASEKTGVGHHNIHKSIKKKNSHAGGFVWFYEDEYVKVIT